MDTLVIGLGNPVLGDDGVGWRVAEALDARLQAANKSYPVTIEFLSLGGLRLMESLIGYDRVILIDAINSGRGEAGDVYTFNLDELPSLETSHLSSSHDTSLQNALLVGRSLGAALPTKIIIVAIEARNIYEFSETLSPQVAASVDKAVQVVISILEE